eukprot:scaffold1291_cov256-Pinguiococcus_pyrenoidosus.AAC.10
MSSYAERLAQVRAARVRRSEPLSERRTCGFRTSRTASARRRSAARAILKACAARGTADRSRATETTPRCRPAAADSAPPCVSEQLVAVSGERGGGGRRSEG